MNASQRPLHNQCVILNKATVCYSVTLPTATFIDRHLKIDRFTDTEHDDLVVHVLSKLQQSKILRKRRWALKQVGGARTEEARFTYLKSIADVIHDVCVDWDAGKDKLGAAIARMVYNPEQSMSSAFLEKSDIKTNTQFVLVSSSTSKARGQRANVPITDISSVGRFRKSEVYQDVRIMLTLIVLVLIMLS